MPAYVSYTRGQLEVKEVEGTDRAKRFDGGVRRQKLRNYERGVLKVMIPHDDNLRDGVRGQHRTQNLAHDLSSELRSGRRDCLRVLLWI